MNERRTYLDWNATAPLRDEARSAMLSALDIVGNPSSPHAEGRRAHGLIESAREQIAHCLRARPENVVFTSGATEAANWLLTPNVSRRGAKKPVVVLLVGATEHACVLHGHRFAPGNAARVPVDSEGLVDLTWLEARLGEIAREHGAGSMMVAIQAANNETGVIQPIDRIASLVDAAGGVFVCDAVQAVGRAHCNAQSVGSGSLFISAHKVGGPKGVGAVIHGTDELRPEPLVRGGGQERRQRSGTENVASIVGFAAALRATICEREDVEARTLDLRRRLETGLRRTWPDSVILGHGAPRLANTTCFALPHFSAETALIALDLEGIAVSSGSACSSGKVARSSVLEAMQASPAIAAAALRVSTGRSTTAADIEACLDALRRIDQRRCGRPSDRRPDGNRKVA